MCGILFHYNEICKVGDSSQFGNDSIFNSLVPVIRERGGDYEKYKTVYNNKIELFSSVLSLRQPLAKQPLIDSQFIIQFNGELYNDEISEGMNDVEYLHSLLIDSNENEMIKIIGHLVGEFAYTITDQMNKKVYYGKDILGRKSLCYSVNDENLYISSCPPHDKEDRFNFVECEKAKIYCYDLENGELTTISFNENIELPTSYQVLNNLVPNNFKEEEFVNELHKRLSNSVHKRISTIFPLPQDQTNSKFAILFSGGIDCTLIAGLCGEICEEGTVIDLLNVSFSNPRANLNYDETPDRCLAINSCKELNDKYNNSNKVKFRLIKINVCYQEYLEAKDRVIKLIYPNDTEMDLSIAIAFYFATSGRNSDGFENSNCKVILSGLGADELFGGYTRHERIFTPISNQVKRRIKNKPVTDTNIYDLSELQSQLRDELQCDLDRLWERNLTRDDKVISCWSKEVRYPFLDEFFVKWVTTDGNVPLTWKLNYNIETGEITRKKALRNLALYMGLDFVAFEPKRAIQFGSKSAKMDIGSGKMKGTDKLQ